MLIRDCKCDHGNKSFMQYLTIFLTVFLLIVKSVDEPVRRVHSGPKERSSVPVEERGEGDGREMPHRAPSSASVRSPPRR